MLKPSAMADTLHLRIKKEYAAALIEDLIKVDAIEAVDDAIQLSLEQKAALDKELDAIKNDPAYLMKWEDIKYRFTKP